MAISEESRHEMYVKFEEVLGARVATTMMEHLPPVGWADVATKYDLDAQSVLLKHDLDAQSVLLKQDLDAQSVLLKHELDALTGLFETRLDAQSVLMKHDLDALGAQFETKLDGQSVRLELQFRSELRGEMNRLMRWQFPTIVTLLGLAFAAAKLS